jgi:transposase InsO family protein
MILHSDRGSRYKSAEFRAKIAKFGVIFLKKQVFGGLGHGLKMSACTGTNFNDTEPVLAEFGYVTK